MITKVQHNRFKDAPWFPKEDTYVIVGGAGGIGSWVSLLLARAGFKPMVYDNDTLEEGNLAGQIYPKKMIGKSKVDALEMIIKDFADEDTIVYNKKIDEKSPTHIYCISAFDNMLARKHMFGNWFKHLVENPHLREKAIFIDGRLEAEQMFIFCVKGNNKQEIDEYAKNNLPDDSNVAEAPCTLKQTSHAAAMIASHITGFFTNHITNVVEGAAIRTVPFKWEYFIPMDLLTVENT